MLVAIFEDIMTLSNLRLEPLLLERLEIALTGVGGRVDSSEHHADAAFYRSVFPRLQHRKKLLDRLREGLVVGVLVGRSFKPPAGFVVVRRQDDVQRELHQPSSTVSFEDRIKGFQFCALQGDLPEHRAFDGQLP